MRPTLLFYSVKRQTSLILCLTPDDFTHQGESAATQWVKPLFGSESMMHFDLTKPN